MPLAERGEVREQPASHHPDGAAGVHHAFSLAVNTVTDVPWAHEELVPHRKWSAGAPPKHQRGLLSTAQKADLCKAVAIGGMSSEQHDAVGAKAKSLGTVTAIDGEVPVAVTAVAKLKQDGCPEGAILVHYSSVKEAMEAVWQLHRCKHKSGGKSVTLWARQVNGEGASVRPHRQPHS